MEAVSAGVAAGDRFGEIQTGFVLGSRLLIVGFLGLKPSQKCWVLQKKVW